MFISTNLPELKMSSQTLVALWIKNKLFFSITNPCIEADNKRKGRANMNSQSRRRKRGLKPVFLAS